ncbi:MAG TPA: hypothetical protein VF038_04310 [Usitatibacter sp.]
MDRIERGTRGDRNLFPRLTIHRALCAACLALAAGAAHAVALGEIEVRSHLGEPLDARIPVSGADAAHLEDDCFAIVRLAAPGTAAAERGAAKLERVNGATWVRVRSSVPMREPAMMLAIRASCPGTRGMVLREYGVLLDPPRTAEAPVPAPVALPMVEREADASGPATQEPARTLAGSSGVAAKPTHARHAAPVKKRAARHHASRGRAPAGRPAADAFVLKLSGPRIDLARSRTMDEAARAKLRERLVTLDADDEMATLLAMHDRVRRLESEVAALQLRVSQLATPLPAPPAATTPRAVAPAAIAAAPAAAKAAKGASEGVPAAKEPWSFPRGSGLAVAALVALLAAALAWRLRRRTLEAQAQAARNAEEAAAADTVAARFAKPAPIEVAEPAAAREPEPIAAPRMRPQPVEPAVPLLAESPAPAAPPSPVEGLDPDEVIAAARRHYEEGALLHAVQLLQRAIEASPREMRPWLALLELLRREGLAVDHAELAVRFHQVHGQGEAWRKVTFFGRELDPTNPLYRDDDPQPLRFDPLAESWLDMPASFDDALATELRHSLLREAARAHPKHAPTPLG